METNALENIKTHCALRGITLAALERKLDFSNGSIAKAKVLPSDRLYLIAKFFGVTMESLLVKGTEEPYNADDYLQSIYQSLNEDGRNELETYAEYLISQERFFEEV